jgi:hypothetical protein
LEKWLREIKADKVEQFQCYLSLLSKKINQIFNSSTPFRSGLISYTFDIIDMIEQAQILCI